MFNFRRQEKNVWDTVRRKKPFFALAPMADATDNAFREIIARKSRIEPSENGLFSWRRFVRADVTENTAHSCAACLSNEAQPNIRCEDCQAELMKNSFSPFPVLRGFDSLMGKRGGGPDIMWTEFVACDGLASEEGRPHLISDLAYTKKQRPIIAQIFGGNPETMFIGAREVAKLNFNGIDINMGCPQEAIIKQRAGADLIRDPKRAKEIVEAVREGVKAAGKNTPVSVKTRIGFSKDILEEWIPELLSLNLPALTIHARTRKDMSKVPARWERVARTVELRNDYAPRTLVIGNGDVASISDGIHKAQETGADGIMIGRAVFGNPWVFTGRSTADISTKEKIETLIEHTKLYERMHPNKNFAIMKKHYSAYVRGFPGAKELRTELMDAETYQDVYNIAEEFLKSL